MEFIDGCFFSAFVTAVMTKGSMLSFLPINSLIAFRLRSICVTSASSITWKWAVVLMLCIIASAIFRRIPLNGIRSDTPSCGTLTLVASGAVSFGGSRTGDDCSVAIGASATGAAATCAGATCNSISEAVTRPPRPVGVTALISIFISRAIFRTAGVAGTFSLPLAWGGVSVLTKLAGRLMLSSTAPTTQPVSGGASSACC